MRRLVVALLIIASFGNHAFTQNLVISKRSSKYFTPQQLRELIREKGWEAVKEYQVPRQIYEHQYTLLEPQLLAALRPVLVKKFKWVEMSDGGRKDIPIYEKEIYRGVRDVIVGSDEFEALYLVDQTDRILNFKSNIHIAKNGTVRVTEKIRIFNGNGEQNYRYNQKYGGERKVNNSILRGLARSFPTLYTTRQGLYVEVPFNVIDIQLDGHQQRYFTDNLKNGVRVRIGDPDKYLEDGVHDYTITYETGNQLIFHDDKDEFYWNVNGNGWEFTADSVSAVVTFPAASKIFEQACYTGTQNSTSKDCSYKLVNDSTIAFAANSMTEQYSGLTVAASIQKGILIAPSKLGIYFGMISTNWPLSAMVLVLLGMFAINLYTWSRIGRDPEQGVIVPQFDAPDGISPADAGYLYNQKFKPDQFSAALVDIAVRKGINIVVKEEGKLFKSKAYFLMRGKPRSSTLESYVSKYYNWKLRDMYDLALRKEYNSTVGKMYTDLSTHLETQFRTDHENYSGRRGFFAWNAGAGSWGFILLVVLGFASFIVIGNFFTLMHGLFLAGLFVVGFIMQYVFYKIMPAMNKEGRHVLDQILGLRMYLVTAEERRFDKLQPPEKTLELFEKLLPYAIALECQNEWSDKFEQIIKDAVANNNYVPTYYSGDMWDMSSMSDGLSSLSSGLSSTISSASTAPSEGGSDGGGGSSGGGSSGGGGGGGGGGGW